MSVYRMSAGSHALRFENARLEYALHPLRLKLQKWNELIVQVLLLMMMML